MATPCHTNWTDYYRLVSSTEGTDEKKMISKGLNSMETTNTTMINNDRYRTRFCPSQCGL
jgi:hypothetical protein